MNKFLLISFIFALILSYQAKSQITEIGLASFYADKFDGRITASGEIFNQNKMTAAHRTLPFGTKVRVTRIDNKKSVVVTVNDRGPFVNNRVIDLSKAAAKKLDFISSGVTRVRIEVISLGKTGNSPTNISHNNSKNNKANSNKTYNKSARATSTVITTTYTTSTSQTDKEYYKIQSKQIIPAGFGIQVASYQEAANLIKRCADIEKKTNKDIIVQVGENSGKKVYRIIVGAFSTKAEADNFKNRIGNKFPGCFVVSL
jgi:rare lipoprotein A